MNDRLRRPWLVVPLMMVGLGLVALSLAWSILRPDRVGLIVENLAFPLGTVPAGGFRRHSWEVRNGGLGPLTLRTRFTSGRCGFSLWLGEEHLIPVGGSYTVSLNCPIPTRAETPFSAHAEVSTSDPCAPRIRFRVFGISGLTDAP